MGYEKKYKEALDRAKEWLNIKEPFTDTCTCVVESIFPELKESEDERIRKELTDYIKKKFENSCSPTPSKNILANWISWLEKQGGQKHIEMKSAEESLGITSEEYNQIVDECIYGEQKPVVEPKFDVDDWVVRKDGKNFADGRKTVRITRFDGERYWFDSGTYLQPKDIRLWNIADAKAGDVLYSPCLRLLWIFKSKDTVYCGCNLNYNDGAFCGEAFFEMPTDATPATKEQRALLFSKMHEAGYEWDEEKLELKEIISGTQDKTDYLLKQNEL